ncbi:hypothetical protein BC828DRAFT_395734 [Blastocladiella britannica]|nr:hypothetical protein BC828DRAFT_395734 [Blastocladiella britannica]
MSAALPGTVLKTTTATTQLAVWSTIPTATTSTTTPTPTPTVLVPSSLADISFPPIQPLPLPTPQSPALWKQPPKLVIAGPSLIPSCTRDAVRVDLFGTRGMSVTYTFAYSGSNAAIAAQFAAVYGSPRVEPLLLIQSQWITEAGFNVTVTAYESFATNGAAYATSAGYSVRRAPVAAGVVVPIVSHSLPAQSVTLGETIHSELLVQVPTCSATNATLTATAIKYSWRLMDETTGVVVVLEGAPAVSGLTTAAVSIPAALLQYGDYTLIGSVTINGTTTAAASLVRIVPSPVSVTLGPAVLSVDSATGTTLAATILDPDTPVLGPRAVTCAWTACSTACYAFSMSCGSLPIPAGFVWLGADVMFVFTVTDRALPSRSASASIVLQAVRPEVPRPVITSDMTQPYLSPGQQMTLTVTPGLVAGRQNKSRYLWNISPRSPTTIAMTAPTSLQSYTVPMDAIAPGSVVIFRCIVAESSNATRSNFAEYVVTAAAPPSQGLFSVTNGATGVGNGGSSDSNVAIPILAWEESLRMAATGWTGGIAPYRYSFGFTRPNATSAAGGDDGAPAASRGMRDSYVAFQQTTPFYSGLVPVPSMASVFLLVTDAVGATVRVDQALSVSTSPTVSTAVILAQATVAAARINATMSAASPRKALSDLVSLALPLDTREMPPSLAPSLPSDRATFSSWHSTILQWLQQLVSSLSPPSSLSVMEIGVAAQSLSVLQSMSFSNASAADLAAALWILEATIPALRSQQSSVAQLLATQAALVLDAIVSAYLMPSPTSSLARRQVDSTYFTTSSVLLSTSTPPAAAPALPETQLQAVVSTILSSLTDGDTCTVPGPARYFGASSASAVVAVTRRQNATAAPSLLAVGSFVIPEASAAVVGGVLSAGLIGCYDVQYSQWVQLHDSQSHGIVSPGVLTIAEFAVDASTGTGTVQQVPSSSAAASGTPQRMQEYTATGLPPPAAGGTTTGSLRCVYWSGTDWINDRCTSTPALQVNGTAGGGVQLSGRTRLRGPAHTDPL